MPVEGVSNEVRVAAVALPGMAVAKSAVTTSSDQVGDRVPLLRSRSVTRGT